MNDPDTWCTTCRNDECECAHLGINHNQEARRAGYES